MLVVFVLFLNMGFGIQTSPVHARSPSHYVTIDLRVWGGWACGRASGGGWALSYSVSLLTPVIGLAAMLCSLGHLAGEHPCASLSFFSLRQFVAQPGLEPMMVSASATPAVGAT